MNCDVVMGCTEEARPGNPTVPEPMDSHEVFLNVTSEENNQSLTPEAEDCASGSVPHDVKSKSGTKKIRLPEHVSMWKYMMRSKRLVLYSFLNNCLRNGELSDIVGFDVTNSVINKEACEFTGVTFWKIDRNSFYADVNVRLKLKSGRSRRVWNGILVCYCCFRQEFSLSVESLIKNTNRKEEGLTMLSPFLVPYYTNQGMDELGEQIWADYSMQEAIIDPGRRNAVELAERMGLSVRHLQVYEHKEMDSIVFFADSDLLVGEDRLEKLPDGRERRIKTNTPVIERIAANTIVVNTNKIRNDYSSFNIYHECIHYYLHNMFFRLQEMASNDIRLVKTTEIEVEDGKELTDPIYFMEKQANRGAYALMMPASDTRKRIQNELGKKDAFSNFGEKYESIGKELSHRMVLPRFRVKARMIQLGHIEAKGSLNYVDRKLIKPFAFDPDSWRESEITYVVSKSTADMLYKQNRDFRAVMDSGHYVYADGHIVRNESRFVKKDCDELFLTDEAAKKVDDCCLRFVRKYVQRNVGEYILGRMFYDAHYVEQTQFYLSDLITVKEMDELDAKMEYQEAFPRTFRDAFDMLLRKNSETVETIAPKLYIAERTLYYWMKTPDRKITPDFVIYISLMWQIPDWISKMLLDRAMIRLSEFDRRHQALEYIRTVLWDQGVDEANKYLIRKGLEPLKL